MLSKKNVFPSLFFPILIFIRFVIFAIDTNFLDWNSTGLCEKASEPEVTTNIYRTNFRSRLYLDPAWLEADCIRMT